MIVCFADLIMYFSGVKNSAIFLGFDFKKYFSSFLFIERLKFKGHNWQLGKIQILRKERKNIGIQCEKRKKKKNERKEKKNWSSTLHRRDTTPRATSNENPYQITSRDIMEVGRLHLEAQGYYTRHHIAAGSLTCWHIFPTR